MFSITLQVPTETISALVGLKGCKVKDTELITCTKISFLKSDKPLSTVKISGRSLMDVERAKKIIIIGTFHHLAQLSIPSPVHFDRPGRKEADLDVKTFAAEINHRKV